VARREFIFHSIWYGIWNESFTTKHAIHLRIDQEKRAEKVQDAHGKEIYVRTHVETEKARHWLKIIGCISHTYKDTGGMVKGFFSNWQDMSIHTHTHLTMMIWFTFSVRKKGLSLYGAALNMWYFTQSNTCLKSYAYTSKLTIMEQSDGGKVVTRLIIIVEMVGK